jgi:steroid 5-alpha reductase family enzyme
MNIVIQVAFLIFIYQFLVFLIALSLKDNSVVDVFWGMGFVLIGGFTLFRNEGIDIHKILINIAILVWGLRLSFHVLIRNWGRGEDFRYKAWRDTWKHFILRSFFQIFMLQGLFMLIIAIPIYLVNSSPSSKVSVLDFIGVAIFIIGFTFEVIGDYQLMQFKKNPDNKGKLINSGLWSITRHPNYFGESTVWFGLSFVSMNYPMGWITLISPLVLTFLLRFVSGVPMLEQKYKGRPDWEDYKKKTAVFVPFVKFL